MEFTVGELEALNSQQIRDFGNRVLPTVARRLGIESHERVTLDYGFADDISDTSLSYLAQYDSDEDAYDYIVSISQQERLGSEWNEDAVRQIFAASPDSNFAISYVDEAGDEVDDPSEAVAIGYDGLLATEHSFMFHIPLKARQLAAAHKAMNYMIYDHDEEMVAGEPAYNRHIAKDGGNLLALERLWHDGELVSDLATEETDLSQVTAIDLKELLVWLKRGGLVSKNTVALSKRWRS